MKKKLIVVVAMILALTMVMGACGNKTEAPAEPAGSSAAATDEPAAEAEPAADADPFANEPTVDLILTQHDPDKSLPGQYLFAWADMVKEKSNGHINVQVNNGGSLAKPTESLDKVRDGSVDLAWGLQSFYPGQFPLTEGLSLPYLPYKSAAQASDTIMDIWENTDLLASEYADVKVILLRMNCDAPILTAKKKLEKASDLKGLTMRATSEPIINWLAEFGAGGQGCPITDLYQNMQQGTFDGALTDWHAVDSFAFYEVAKYYADEQVNYNTYYFVMNKGVYEGLSPALQAVIDECSGQAALDLMKTAWDDMTEGTKQKAIDAGDEVYTLPAEEHQKLVDAAAKVTDTWLAANGDAAKQIYDLILEKSA